MAENFVLGGEPWAIRSSARTWSAFASSASTASWDIKGVDAADFVGDEGDTFRSKVNDDLPPNLDTTSEAWGIVAAALTTYADKLEEYQSQLASLKTQYDNQQQIASETSTNLETAQQSDQTEQDRITTARADLKSGEKLPASSYVSQTADAQSTFNEADQNVQDTLDAATQIRRDHRTAVEACCQDIDKAKDLRFEQPPGFLGKLVNSVGDWITEHADLLKALSSVLKTISGIAGILSMIPFLAPIMGPIALATGAAALVIDVGIKLATGEGSWTQIGLDALGMIPGARAAKLAMGADIAVTAHDVATGDASVADLAMTVGMAAVGAKGGKPGHSNSSPSVKVDGPSPGRSGPTDPPAPPPDGPTPAKNPESDKVDAYRTAVAPKEGQAPVPEHWLEPTARKIPDSWGMPKRGKASKDTKGRVTMRFAEGTKGKNTVRIDKGDPTLENETQQVDHVVITSDGKPVGREGRDIGSKKGDVDAIDAHIPFDEWKDWGQWNHPNP